MRRVILVTGPPCSGKSTHVSQNAHIGDLILDQDVIGQAAMVQGLIRVKAMTDGTAWVIRCAPGPRVRDHLAQQIKATERVHLQPPEGVLIKRARQRPNPRRHIAAIRAWLGREQSDPAPPQPRAPRTKGSTTERGYGWAHQQARAQAIRGMHDGDPCPRCHRPMWRAQARLLDLDHTDDRTGYQGLAHRRCNRRAGQAASMRARRPQQHTATAANATRSRNW